jgi:hypothetical protein
MPQPSYHCQGPVRSAMRSSTPPAPKPCAPEGETGPIADDGVAEVRRGSYPATRFAVSGVAETPVGTTGRRVGWSGRIRWGDPGGTVSSISAGSPQVRSWSGKVVRNSWGESASAEAPDTPARRLSALGGKQRF